MAIRRLVLVFLIFFLFFVKVENILAQVIINEFSALSSPDWVEIYNLGEEIVDLDGWKIRDDTLTNKIDLSGLICPASFRKFDFSNRLNNAGDEIRLVNNKEEEIDRVVYFSAQVPVHLVNQSTGRSPNGADFWQVFFLPNPQDEACFLPIPTPTVTISPTPSPAITPLPTPTPTALLTPTPTITISPTSSPQDYDNIFLNEIMPNPKEGSEWIELYNGNDFKVNLIDWLIDDLADGGSSPQRFSLIIEANSYGVIDLTRAIFNNTGDQVRLLNSQGVLKDDFLYSNTTIGQSWGRFDGSWCLQEPTPNRSNLICLSLLTTPTPVPTKTILSTTLSGSLASSRFGQNDVLGQVDYQGRLIDPDLKDYLLDTEEPLSLLAIKRSRRPRRNWLPDWLLFFWGGLSLGLGLIRMVKKKTDSSSTFSLKILKEGSRDFTNIGL
ncbi:MAG: lamin tail domain-containing protein [Candidatus Shapirobacteria bacterium]|nr:lamin tail domain-containing protein [Candidatus Shapirobacteria bacterium]